jgi:tRNA (guanine37-N1)-methyltransferase
MEKIRAYSVLGNIAIVNFPNESKKRDKLEFAKKIISENKTIKTVLEKTGKFKGRLRKMETKHVFGEKTKEVLYKENGCLFRFNIDTTYFSPRLSGERKEISSLINPGEKVLVLFAGVGPFSIVIAKNSNPAILISNELNREANKYGKLNIELNKLKDKVLLANGDAKKVCEKLSKISKERFDVIVMPSPQLKDSFLEDAFKVSKKGTRIYYYDFCHNDKIDEKVEMVKNEAKKANKQIKILKVKEAGAIAPGKSRIRIDFEVF